MKLTPTLAVLLSTTIILSPLLASANTFDPNFLLSDEEMQDASAMNTTEIQTFLNENGGYIARYSTEDAYGVYRTAAEIIFNASQQYRINPKYLLVKLQKEQSLVTAAQPTQKALDGATGYGISDGCGWTCETYLNNKGFGKQVDSAAGIMRWYYNNVDQKSWIKRPYQNYTIDGTTVVPANYATAFLYTYTPHLQGNKNFWNLWQKWFDQIYPNGSLVKTADSGNIYLVQDGKKRHITSMTALITRYNPNLVITIPASELARYETGSPISLPNYSILKQGDNYYLLDYDQLRQFTSYDVVRSLGYHPDEIVEVSSADLAGYSTGRQISSAKANPLGELVKMKEDNTLYYVNDGVYSPIFDEEIAKINFPNLSRRTASATEFASLTPGEPVKLKDGTIFGIKGSNWIYVMEGGEKRHIASGEVFTGLGYKWENIVWMNHYAGTAHENGPALYLRQGSTAVNNTVTAQVPSAPVPAVEMIRTPAEQTVYQGPNFTTDLDVYLVADYETGEILAGKNVDVQRPMASFTKVMSAYRLMVHGLNLEGVVAYNEAEHRSRFHNFRVVDGEQIYVHHLLDSFLVSSLNTPAYMLIDGARVELADFVKGMNEQAKNWGLTKTVFTDPAGTGLSNVTSARDYLTLYTKATENSTVTEYLGKKYYEYNEVLDIDGKPRHYDYHSNSLANESGLGFNIITSKTGYLEEAGAGLAMLVERTRDQKKFVIITMGNADYNGRFNEPKRLTTWALANF